MGNVGPSAPTPAATRPSEAPLPKVDYTPIWSMFEEFLGTRFAWALLLVAAVGLCLLGKVRARFAVPLAVLVPACFLVLVVGLRTHAPSEKYFYPLSIPMYLGLAVTASALIRRVRDKPFVFCVVVAIAISAGGYRCYQVQRKLQASFSARWMRYQGSALLMCAMRRSGSEDTILHPWMMEERAQFYRKVLRYPGNLCRVPSTITGARNLWIVVTRRSLKKRHNTRPWLPLIRQGVLDPSVAMAATSPGVAHVKSGALTKWYPVSEIVGTREHIRWKTPKIAKAR